LSATPLGSRQPAGSPCRCCDALRTCLTALSVERRVIVDRPLPCESSKRRQGSPMSEKTVKVRRFYARRKLAELLRQPAWNEAAHDGNEQ